MLKKIETMQNLGVFLDFNWDRDFSRDSKKNFKKINIIYGRNYSGKTTISRVLRSLEIKELPSKFHNPKYKLLFEDASVLTEAEIKTQSKDVRVFNEEFVFSNLKFLNDPNATIAPFAVLGSDNSRIEAEIEKLELELGINEENNKTGLYKTLFDVDQEYKKTHDKYESTKNSVDKKIKDKAIGNPIGIKYNADKFGDINYDSRKLTNDIEQVMSEEYSPLLAEQIKENEALVFEKEKLPQPDYRVPKLNIEDFCKSASEIISRKIGASSKIIELLRDVALHDWAFKGLTLHKEKSTCVFCGNNITNERIELLNAHFDEETMRLETDITNLIRKIEKECFDIKSSLKIDKDKFYYIFHDKIDKITADFEVYALLHIKQLNNIVEQLTNRKNNIVQANVFSPITDCSTQLLEIYNSYSDIIKECNDFSKDKKNKKTAAQRNLLLHEVFVFCQTIDYPALRDCLASLEKTKTGCKEALDLINLNVQDKISEIEALKRQLNDEEEGARKVNEYLTHYFGHGFLELQAEKNADGNNKFKFNIIRDGNIAFNLSEGEKSLIAFCYFMAKLKDTQTADKKPIIWIDDPISSLDSNHVFFLYALLRAEIFGSSKFTQLFISTHNLDFFKYLKRLTGKDNADDPNINYYMLQRIDKTSKITIMPKHMKKFVTEFNFLFSEIYKCSQITTIDDENYTSFYNFGNNSRKFLEILLHYLYPDNSKEEDKRKRFFGNEVIPTILTERINNEYSHLCGVFERGEKPVEVPEMLKVAKLIVETLERKNPEQYEALLKSISETT